MTARYFVGEDGRSLKVIVGNSPPPDGMTEVPSGPPGPGYQWDGSDWALVPVVPSMTVAQIIKAFTPDQRASLLANLKIQAFMWGATADQTIAADEPLLAEAIQVAVSEQLLGADTQAQIEAALAPLLS